MTHLGVKSHQNSRDKLIVSPIKANEWLATVPLSTFNHSFHFSDRQSSEVLVRPSPLQLSRNAMKGECALRAEMHSKLSVLVHQKASRKYDDFHHRAYDYEGKIVDSFN